MASKHMSDWAAAQASLGLDGLDHDSGQYVRVVGHDPLIHRDVASAVNGLVDLLKGERRSVPDAVIYEASRLESLLFSGYDPHFEGDEPPGL
jgi:hypothetical protein